MPSRAPLALGLLAMTGCAMSLSHGPGQHGLHSERPIEVTLDEDRRGLTATLTYACGYRAERRLTVPPTRVLTVFVFDPADRVPGSRSRLGAAPAERSLEQVIEGLLASRADVRPAAAREQLAAGADPASTTIVVVVPVLGDPLVDGSRQGIDVLSPVRRPDGWFEPRFSLCGAPPGSFSPHLVHPP
ncbi:MAG: hypothetical protein KF878_06435 [Planctomycetes bacterium]|nr:hypothetical protein [Planctomycetota bacterium]